MLRFVIGVMPVYIGFALFGFVAFSESTKRASVYLYCKEG